MIQSYLRLVLAILVLLAGLSACSREDGVTFDKTIKVNQPDRYARYINQVAALPSGDYTIVAATNTTGVSGDFTLSVTDDAGTVQTYTGS